MKLIYTLIITLLLIFGCTKHPNFQVTKNGIQSNSPIPYELELYEIAVTKFSEKEKPLSYDIIKYIGGCKPIPAFSSYFADSVYTKKEKEILAYHYAQKESLLNTELNSATPIKEDEKITVLNTSQKIIDSIVDENFPFQEQKEILFYKKSKNYKWFTWSNKKDIISKLVVADTLPLTFKKNQWYYIHFLTSNHLTYKVFFQFKNTGEIEQYEHKKRNFSS